MVQRSELKGAISYDNAFTLQAREKVGAHAIDSERHQPGYWIGEYGGGQHQR